MNSDALSPFFFSLQVALISTLLSFLIAIPLARFRLDRRGVLWNMMDALLVLPIALPPTVVGLFLLTVFGMNSPIGYALRDLGFEILFNWPAAVLASTTVAFPLMYQTSRSAFRQIDRELLDTARIFGYAGHRLTWEIMIPLAWPGIAAGLVLTFLRAIGEFGATLMVAGNIPGKTQTLPVALFFAVEANRLSHAWLLALLVIAVSLLALLLAGFSNRKRDLG